MAGSLNRAGKRYADRSKSSIISHLLNDDADNCRRQMEQRGIKPKNHHRDNLKQIAKIAATNKQREQDKIERANRAAKRNPKYAKVHSKVKVPANTATMTKHTQNRTNFIAKNMSKIQAASAVNKKDKTSMKRKAAIPRRSELDSEPKSMEKKDFVALNKQNGQQMHRKTEERKETKFVDKADYGKVPQYMIQRKLEKEQKEREEIAEAERRKIPPGMRKMTEEERAETMHILECNKKQVIDAIKQLPLVIETPSMIRRQGELHKKIKEIESTMAIFRKPTVFVAMDMEE